MSMSADDKLEVTGQVGVDGMIENYVDTMFGNLDERNAANPVNASSESKFQGGKFVAKQYPEPFTHPSNNNTAYPRKVDPVSNWVPSTSWTPKEYPAEFTAPSYSNVVNTNYVPGDIKVQGPVQVEQYPKPFGHPSQN